MRYKQEEDTLATRAIIPGCLIDNNTALVLAIK